jgi:hypothetical protein
MTTQEKLKAIIARVPLDHDYTDEHISMMVITSYVNDLANLGLIMAAYEVTPLGKSVVAVCEEFDWQPTDEHIDMFVNELVAPEDRRAFRHFIREYRDNREVLIKKIKKFKDSQNE